MVMPIFQRAYSQISNITFSFPEFAPACKKSVHSIYSLLRYSQFYSPVTRLAAPIFDHSRPNFFDQLLIYVNFYQHAKNKAMSLICFGGLID